MSKKPKATWRDTKLKVKRRDKKILKFGYFKWLFRSVIPSQIVVQSNVNILRCRTVTYWTLDSNLWTGRTRYALVKIAGLFVQYNKTLIGYPILNSQLKYFVISGLDESTKSYYSRGAKLDSTFLTFGSSLVWFRGSSVRSHGRFVKCGHQRLQTFLLIYYIYGILDNNKKRTKFDGYGADKYTIECR